MAQLTNIQEEIKAAGANLEQIDRILDKIEERLHEIEDTTDGLNKATSEEVGEYQNLDSTFKNIMQKREQIVKGIVEEEEATRNLADANDELNGKIEDGTKKVKEYETSYGRLGAEANTALGIVSNMLKETNPAISIAIGSVQKLIPNIAECAKAFSKVGANAAAAGVKITGLGKAIKVALSGTGIMLAITALTSVIAAIDNIKRKHEEAAEKAKEHADAEKKAAQESADAWNSLMDDVDSYLNPKTQKQRIIGRLEEAKAEREYTAALIESIKARRGLSTEEQKQLEDQKAKIKELEYQIEAVKNKKEGGSTKRTIDPETILNSSDWKKAIAKASEMIDSDIDGIILKTFGYVSEKMEAEDYDTILEEVLGITEKKKKEAEEAFKEIVLGLSDKDMSDLDASMNGIAEGLMNEQIAQSDAEKAIYDARLENYSNFISSYASLTESISGMIADNLDAELEAGKITEKEYKRRKKALQAFQISSIVANTAAGIVDIWKSYAAEKIGNANAANATGPAAPATLAALNSKSLISAILQTGTLAAAGAAGIASINSGSISASSTPTASTPAPTINYVSNPSFTETADAAKTTAQNTTTVAENSGIQPVLVVEDLNQVQGHMTSVKVNSSF